MSKNFIFEDVFFEPVYVPKSKKKFRESLEKNAKEICDKNNWDYEKAFNFILANKFVTPAGQYYITDKHRKDVQNQLSQIYDGKITKINFDDTFKKFNPWILEYIEKYISSNTIKHRINLLTLIPFDTEINDDITQEEINRFIFRTALFDFGNLSQINLDNITESQLKDISQILSNSTNKLQDLYEELYNLPVSDRKEIENTKERIYEETKKIFNFLEEDSRFSRLFKITISHVSHVLNISFKQFSVTERLHKFYSSHFQLFTISRALLWPNEENCKEFLIYCKYISGLDESKLLNMEEKYRNFYDMVFTMLSDILLTQLPFNFVEPNFKINQFPYELLDVTKEAFFLSDISRKNFHLLNEKFSENKQNGNS